MTTKLKRYHATLSVYIYSENDEDARQQLYKMCADIDLEHDNSCKPTELLENPYGAIITSDKNLLHD